MPHRSMLVAIAVAAFAVTAAVANDLGDVSGQAAPRAAKPHASVKKPKSVAPDPGDGGLDQIPFSQPNASPLAPAKSAKAAAPRPGAAPSEPDGGVSLDFKWRATHDQTDPFDAVRHSSGPNGPGDAVQGGVKLGF